ncbi:MAG TPA: prolyl oligopeptidase family serine peptidase [Terriglobales bacterium]|nr:prolyl oligopeptidase family serine peptidase [Terriglobales bacterium]
MRGTIEPPPTSYIERVTEVLHGVSVEDPYRWLEDQDSPRTREWITAQTQYARSYLDAIRGRERIRDRVRQLLDVETYDSLQKMGRRYFFTKRLPGQEQPCIYFRDGWDGIDELLIDPSLRGSGPYSAVKPLRISPDGRLLLYEVKQGGERTGTFEFFDIDTRKTLPDVLPRGYLRGFVFAPDSRSFYYVHETVNAQRQKRNAAHQHVLGTSFAEDRKVFSPGDDEKLRLHIVSDPTHLGFLVLRFGHITATDFYLWLFDSQDEPELLIQNAEYLFAPRLVKDGRIVAMTDRKAPNFRIVEIQRRNSIEPEFVDLVPVCNARIQNWTVCGDRIFVSYLRNMETETDIFDLSGHCIGHLQVRPGNTIRLLGGSEDSDELFFEQESFTTPIRICSYRSYAGEVTPWAERKVPFDSQAFTYTKISFPSKDGTQIPMFLVGRQEVLAGGVHPAIMTSYGGYGVAMTPQFSVFVAFLMERGCLFALPNIRGGSEFGAAWHEAAKRTRRQVAFDDFIGAAEWLIQTGRTEPEKLAIFGGSNSGLLVGAALTQRPDLFRAVVCIAPMLDMLRYHLFDNAHVWKDEFGTVEDADDFRALLSYSPYHNVHNGVRYPATMIVSGDADQNCNPLHARKMTSRLQAASPSANPIFLDYSPYRGHSPVLPLGERIEALTDRMAFLCDQLQLTV